MKVLALFGQLSHSRVDNEQTRILSNALANNGTLYKREVFFNIFIKLPNIILSILPVWLCIKHIDDFKDIEDCDVIVASGKKMIRYAKHLRKNAFPNAKIVQIGNPYCSIAKNDILLRQNTSKFIFSCKNTITCRGLLCEKVSKEIADKECEKYDKIKQALNGEFIAVFIGGNRYFRMSQYDAKQFAIQIDKISNLMCMPLLIVASTGVSKKVVEVIKNHLQCSYYFYNKADNPKDSPKVAFMSFAKYYIVADNSINDVSEYVSQGKPTYIFFNSKNSKRYRQFCEQLFQNVIARVLFNDMEQLEHFVPNKLNDVEDIVKQIKEIVNVGDNGVMD